MKYLSFLVFLLLSPSLSLATKINFRTVRAGNNIHAAPSPLRRRQPQSPGDSQTAVGAAGDDTDSSFDLKSVNDMIYFADITVGGQDYSVQLDTGSSDLFIRGRTTPLPGSTSTSLAHNLTYASGWAYGNVAYAPVEFLNLSIPHQAFLDVTVANNSALSEGGDGVIGLGFTRLSSMNLELGKTGSTTGKSLLQNLFEVNPSEPNYMTFALHRATQTDGDDGEYEVDGSFTLGEVEEEYSEILGTSAIPTWPISNPFRWNVLLDSFIVNHNVNQTITPGKTTLTGSPSNKAVVLLDSGASHTYAPAEVAEAIYGGIPGATYDAARNWWRVPCDYEINMALQIGGRIFPIHPLDLTFRANTRNATALCFGSFVPTKLGVDKWDFDWLIGDNFLRSVYTMYDLGDFDESGKMGDPYVKLLSVVNPDAASIAFHKQRGGEPRTGITFVGLDDLSIAPSFFISNDISKSLEMIGTWMPVILAIVALNALLVVVAAIFWITSFIRKRRRRAQARVPRSRQSPMPPINSYIAGVPQSAGHSQHSPSIHVYEPVSMALTEDTFVPPSPAFHSKMQPGDRPKSAVL